MLLVANIIVLPSFGSPSNFDTNLMLFAPFALVAMAATPAILSGGGGIDMSVGLNAGLVSNVLILYLLPHGAWGDPWLAVPLVLALGTALGVAQRPLGRGPPLPAGDRDAVHALRAPGGQPEDRRRADARAAELARAISPRGSARFPAASSSWPVPLVAWLALQRTPFHRIAALRRRQRRDRVLRRA